MIKQGSPFSVQAPPHPQLSKIRALYRAYGDQYDFCRFYLAQNSAGIPCAVFSVLDGAVSGYGWRPDADEEWAEFLKMLPGFAGASVCSDTLPGFLKDYPQRTGTVLVKKLSGRGETFSESPDYRQAYRILGEAFPGSFLPGDFDSWYCDICHRVRHETDVLFSWEQAAGLITACPGEYGVIRLAAVAPFAQGKGIGSRLLAAMEATAVEKGCNMAAVFSKDYKTDLFYQKNGYLPAGKWTEIHPTAERNQE